MFPLQTEKQKKNLKRKTTVVKAEAEADGKEARRLVLGDMKEFEMKRCESEDLQWVENAQDHGMQGIV